MRNLPCKDCLIFPICKHPQANPSNYQRFKLIEKCNLLKVYFRYAYNQANFGLSYQERLSVFYKHYGSKYTPYQSTEKSYEQPTL